MDKMTESTHQKFAKDLLSIGAAHLLAALTGFLMLPLSQYLRDSPNCKRRTQI